MSKHVLSKARLSTQTSNNREIAHERLPEFRAEIDLNHGGCMLDINVTCISGYFVSFLLISGWKNFGTKTLLNLGMA